MSLAMKINVTDRVTSEMQRLALAVDSDAVKDFVGESIVNAIQENFRELDTERPNKLGGRRTHWYAEAGEGTTYEKVDDGVDITIVQEGIRTRILGTGVLPGGAIVPVNAQMLTIPAIPEAYGKLAGEFDNLRAIFGKRKDGSIGPVALAEAEDDNVDMETGQFKRGRVKGGVTKLGEASIDTRQIFFWLTQSVVQDADPSLLPTEEVMRNAAFAKLDEFIASFQGAING